MPGSNDGHGPNLESGGTALGTVQRVLRLLQVITYSQEPISASELAEALALPVSTTHRLVQLLRKNDMVDVVPESRRYVPGPELLRMATALHGRTGLVERARPVLERIVERCGETAQLAVYLPADEAIAFMAQVESPHVLRFAIPLHIPQPLAWGSSGRVVLAFLPEDEAERIVDRSEISPVSGERGPAWRTLAPELRRIRQAGWDMTRGEKLAHAVGFAAPIFAHGKVIGSVSVPIPTIRYVDSDHEVYRDLVLEAGSSLSS